MRNTIENNETDLEQTIDTRLLLNNKNHTKAEEFTTMIREYNTYGNSTINEVGAYIINRAECRHKTKRAYQNAVRAERTKMNFQITSVDLTPAYTPAASLATADVPDHSINAVRL
jgi:VCBS repeat-containing protein